MARSTAAEEGPIPDIQWHAPPDDIHVIRGAEAGYPLTYELWPSGDAPGDLQVWYRPLLAGVEEFQRELVHPEIEISQEQTPDGPEERLTIPDTATLGTFVLELQVREVGDDEVLDQRRRRVHVHEQLTALWLDPPRLTVRQGHRVRPRIMAVFDDPDGDGTGPHATAVELTDRAFGWDSSYTRHYLRLATDDDIIDLHDPDDVAEGETSRSWQLTANADAGAAQLRVEVRPDTRAQDLGLEYEDGDPPPLVSPPIELVAAPAFDAVPEEHRRLHHVAGSWPDPASDATNILFLTEGFREDEWVDDLLLGRVRALLGASDPDDVQSLRSPTHAPWNELLEQGRLNIFMAHLPSAQDGVTLGYRGAALDLDGDLKEPYEPPPLPRLESEPTNPFMAQVSPQPPPECEPDDEDDHEWTLRHVLHTVGYPSRHDRDADYLATLEAWHHRYAAGGSVPAMFVDGAEPDQQPIERRVFDLWRRFAEPRFADGRDTAFGLTLGGISSGATHGRAARPQWGVYPDISHINTYLMGLLPPAVEDGEEPDHDLVARWMDPEGDLEDDEPEDIAGPDRPFVYLLINGVHVRGHHRSSTDPRERYMVSGLHRRRPGARGHADVFLPDPDPGDADRPDRHFRVSLLPAGATMTEQQEASCIGTVLHELHHAFGLGDEYEGSGEEAAQAGWAINLVPPLEVDDDGDDGNGDEGDVDDDDGAAFLERGLPWDVARARWADRIEDVEDTDDGHLRVTLLERSEDHHPPEEVRGHLRIRRPLRRRGGTDDLEPPEVSDRLEVVEEGSEYPQLVLRAVDDDGTLPAAADIAARSVLFAPVLADAQEPGSWLRLVSPAVRAHLEGSETIMNPDHDCDECNDDNDTVTQPEGLGFDPGLSPSRLVGVYRGGGTTRCSAYRPTGISRMRQSYPEEEIYALHAGHRGLQLWDLLLDQLPESISQWAVFRAVLEREVSFPPSVVEGYTLGDVVDPFVLGAVDERHAKHVPDGDA